MEIVNRAQTEAEVNTIPRCILRGCPDGNDDWVQRTAESLALESTLDPRGRPKVAQEQ